MPEYKVVSRDLLIEPPQPLRMSMDEEKLHELAESLKLYGVISPLVVVPANGRYEVVDGHRRYIAAGLVGIADLPVAIFDAVEDAKFGMMLHANVMREDVTAAEEGVQFLELAEQRGWSVNDLVRFFGRSENYINDRCRLVQKFPDVMQPVAARQITWTQAKAIMRCPDLKWRAYLLEQADTHGASARALSNMVDQWVAIQNSGAGLPAPHTPEHGTPLVLNPPARCTWCNREDDQQNMVDVKVHSYHVRDLQLFLERVGVGSRVPSAS